MKKYNKNGFTLVEMLAVIVILGIFIIIAVPSVTSYISNTRKSAYVDTVKSLVTEAKTRVNDGELKVRKLDTIYYIPSSCLKLEDGEADSPYGKFAKAYVAITYDGSAYHYYWTSVDETGQGVKTLTNIEDLTEDDITPDLSLSDINTNIAIEGKSNIVRYTSACVPETDEPEPEPEPEPEVDTDTWTYKDLKITIKVDDVPCNLENGYSVCYNSKVAVINIGDTKTIKSFKASFDVPEGTILMNSGWDPEKVQISLVGTRLTIIGNKNSLTWNYLTPDFLYDTGFQIKYPSNVEFKLTNPSIEYTELVSDTQTGESTGGVQGNAEYMYIDLPTLKIEIKRMNYWTGGNGTFFTQNDVYVTNISDHEIKDWSFVLETPNAVKNVTAYNPLIISSSGNIHTFTPFEWDSDARTLSPGEKITYPNKLVFETTDTNALPQIR